VNGYKNYYTTKDSCKVLNIKPDTFRYRLRKGYYLEPRKVGSKRRFSETNIREIVQIAKKDRFKDKIKM
jgi:predicted site-specific integrase-resolvase